MDKIKHHTIIISDLHLGSPMCQANALSEFLNNIEVKYLILNGDVFENLKKTFRLRDSHWKALDQLRRMSDHCQVIWVKGNHDTLGYMKKKDDIKYIGNLLGLKIKREFHWEVGIYKYCAIHGDMWDNYIYKYPTLSNAVTWIYDIMKEANSEWMKSFTRWIKKKSKILMRNGNYVMEGALDYAEDREMHGIFCGHTHRAELLEREKIIYGNSGTWESADPTFIAIDEDVISLYKFLEDKVNLEKQIKLHE